MDIYIYLYYNPPLGGAALISWRNEGTNAGTNLTTQSNKKSRHMMTWSEAKRIKKGMNGQKRQREFPTWQSREGSWTAKSIVFVPRVFLVLPMNFRDDRAWWISNWQIWRPSSELPDLGRLKLHWSGIKPLKPMCEPHLWILAHWSFI